MAAAKSLKKNVTIEVRLPDEAKSAFMARCVRENRTASDAIRSFIDQQLGAPDRRVRRRPTLRLAAAALFGTLLGAGVAVPSLAHSLPPSRTSFEHLDRNHDGVLTYKEYRAR